MNVTSVYVCEGKDCRKRWQKEKLSKVLDDLGVDSKSVKCQKICKGPVVGFKLKNQVEWFSKLRGKEGCKALRQALKENQPKKIWTHREKKRSGKLRH